jgi:hypothetical protein
MTVYLQKKALGIEWLFVFNAAVVKPRQSVPFHNLIITKRRAIRGKHASTPTGTSIVMLPFMTSLKIKMDFKYWNCAFKFSYVLCSLITFTLLKQAPGRILRPFHASKA